MVEEMKLVSNKELMEPKKLIFNEKEGEGGNKVKNGWGYYKGVEVMENAGM